MGLLEAAMIFYSSNVLGVEAPRLINYISRIHVVIIVVIYLGIHAAHVYIWCSKIGLNEWK
jgi:hypothetical protein